METEEAGWQQGSPMAWLDAWRLAGQCPPALSLVPPSLGHVPTEEDTLARGEMGQ